jgi:pimeloyl-ACP methyl ester carboxylesterase
MTTTSTWTDEIVEVAGVRLQMIRAGTGDPLLLLHRDIGAHAPLEFHNSLAERFTVYVPTHPGYGGSERPAWMRSARDLAVVYQWLLSDLGLENVTLAGLGLGGWVAAEMATMSPRAFRRLVLVSAMGIKPEHGDILDQALFNHIDYVRHGLHDPTVFDSLFGEPDTDQLEAWEMNREMTFRIAWKPYMYSQTLPYLLGGVRAPALVAWGAEDRVVPLECGERYAAALPTARLEVIPATGHLVELESANALAAAITSFAAGT